MSHLLARASDELLCTLWPLDTFLSDPHYACSTWQQRSYEFASYLFLVQLFPSTTLQPSIFGFCTTGAAIVLAGTVGHLVDEFPRVRFVRGTILAQKGTLACSYAVFLACFVRLYAVAQERREQRP